MEKRKWSEAECQRWFVQGTGKLTELAQLSNAPYGTLKRWCTAGKWVEKRKQFRAELYSQTEQKTIDKASDQISEQWATLTIEHLEGFQLCRKIALLKARYIQSQLEKLQVEESMRRSIGADVEEVEQEQAEKLAQLCLDDLAVCSQVIDRCVKGERLVLSMEYVDINRAIAAVERTGLKVVSPSDAMIVNLQKGASNS
jgi:hypothetical protein